MDRDGRLINAGLMTCPSRCFPVAVLCLLGIVASNTAAADKALLQPFNSEPAAGSPMNPQEVVSKTPLPDGFQLSVFASEPDVHQPISMATDPRGRLWVAENYTYSESKVGYHTQLRDRIVVFEDANNDGIADKRTVFWEGAERLTSVEVGLGGVWALALPNLVFLPDANGDAVADGPPQVILDGFEYLRGSHTVANGLRWGPDGWLYGRHGIQSTSFIGPPGSPEQTRTAMNVGIWRYDPKRRVTEVVAEGTTNPWGMDWDARGEPFFINTVIGHLWHVFPGAHYRRMYGQDPTPYIYEPIEQHADHVHWAQGEVWTDVRKGVTDVTLAAGGGHAHTGLLIYQGGQWPASWNGKLLTINFHGRRLNVERLDPQGSGFVGRREPDTFLFADPWFRGIDLLAAPDGGVFVSDWSDTGECHDNDGIHRTSGRIYKIRYGSPTIRSAPDLAILSEPELAALQTSANDWMARQARRVLADRAAKGESLTIARSQLKAMVISAEDEVHRLRAMWAMHVSGGSNWDLLKTKLNGTPSERSWAIRLLEDGAHRDTVGAKAFDQFAKNQLTQYAALEPSATVRLTLASLLQKLPNDQRGALAHALLQHAEDAADHNLPRLLWYGIAPLASRGSEFSRLLAKAKIPLVQRFGARRLAEAIDQAPQSVNDLLVALLQMRDPTAQLAILDGLADGLAGRRKVPKPIAWDEVESAFRQETSDPLKNRIRDLSALFGDGRALNQIREIALNAKADAPRRRAALQSLIEARADGLREVCESLLPIRELSATAAAGLALFDSPAVAERLLAEWPNLYGHERPQFMNALLSRPQWASKVLDAMANGRIRRTDFSVVHARQIRAFNQPELIRRLVEVWGSLQEPTEASRTEATQRWRQRLTADTLQQANPTEGRKVYANTCGACHKLYGEGGTLGPDLTGSGRHNLDYLLENILFPNAVVPAEFRQTSLQLKDGRTLSGIVRSRTAKTIVFEMVGEKSTINSADIESETVGSASLMPEGQLDSLPPTQAIDLMAYLMSTVPPSRPSN